MESSQTRDPACVPCTGSGFLTIGPPGKFKRWFFGNLLSSWSASFPIKTFIPVPTTCLPTDWSVYCVRGRESLGSVIELGWKSGNMIQDPSLFSEYSTQPFLYPISPICQRNSGQLFTRVCSLSLLRLCYHFINPHFAFLASMSCLETLSVIRHT